MNTQQRHFRNFLQPRSVAIVGASPQRGNPRNTLVRNLQKHGFDGRIYPVSPSNAEIEGLKAYKSVGELPEAPDVALIITPAETVPGIIAECGDKGIRNAIVFSAGFEEVEGGKEDRAAHGGGGTAARRGRARPQLPGHLVGAAEDHAYLQSARRSDRETLRHAPVAVISQSGALAGAIGNALQDTRHRLLLHRQRRQRDLLWTRSMPLAAIIEQDDVRVVALYIEGLDDAARILPHRRARPRARRADRRPESRPFRGRPASHGVAHRQDRIVARRLCRRVRAGRASSRSNSLAGSDRSGRSAGVPARTPASAAMPRAASPS